jgi:hypothetical protein
MVHRRRRPAPPCRIAGVDDLDSAVAELERAGIPYVRGQQDQRGVIVAQIFVVDPAGNVVELQEDKE